MSGQSIFQNQNIAITWTQVLTSTATYDIAAIVGTRVIPTAGNRGAVLLGLLVLSGVLPYASCAYVAAASGASDVPLKAVALFGLPALILILWGRTANPRHHVAIVIPSGETIVATVVSLEEAHRIQGAIAHARAAQGR